MLSKPDESTVVPEETFRLAHVVCPEDDRCFVLHDEMSEVFTDRLFADLFPHRGQPGVSPWRLALITILQFMDGLSDRQAVHAVRTRIDWKYLLRLPLEDQGFDYSVLSEFRTRLLHGQAEARLFEAVLSRAQQRGWVKARGKQRTDSTHVVAAIETLSRLECIGETLRHTVNVLAIVVPGWVREQVPSEWRERYARRWEDFRLPSGRDDRELIAEQIGTDGRYVLERIDASEPWLRAIPAVRTLRQVWIQQFYADSPVRWRKAADLPPAERLISTPYDVEARYCQKRSTIWTGYKVHLTETCDEQSPRLITDVQTTPATTPDFTMTPIVQSALAQRALLPEQHILDAGYIAADHLVTSQTLYHIDLLGPVGPDNSWQSQQNAGFGAADFCLDWTQQTARCPQGHLSKSWTPGIDRHRNEVIYVKFGRGDCRACSVRSHCTRSPTEARTLNLRPHASYQALLQARARQQTEAFAEQYAARAGIEGALSQGIRSFGLRRCRYIGESKARLQHLMTAVAINLVRLVAWKADTPLGCTRLSPFARVLLAG